MDKKLPTVLPSAYETKYSETDFWGKVRSTAKFAGQKVLDPALTMYYAANDENTPVWAKTAVYGALGYFIAPLDAIPDLAPLIGFSDDLGVLTAAVLTIGAHIKDKHKEQADAKLKDWFGEKD